MQGDPTHIFLASGLSSTLYVCENFANMRVQRNLLEEALAMYKSSFTATSGVARTLFKLSQVYETLHEEEKAKAALDEAMTMARTLGGTASSPDNERELEAMFDSLVPYMDR